MAHFRLPVLCKFSELFSSSSWRAFCLASRGACTQHSGSLVFGQRVEGISRCGVMELLLCKAPSFPPRPCQPPQQPGPPRSASPLCYLSPTLGCGNWLHVESQGDCGAHLGSFPFSQGSQIHTACCRGSDTRASTCPPSLVVARSAEVGQSPGTQKRSEVEAWCDRLLKVCVFIPSPLLLFTVSDWKSSTFIWVLYEPIMLYL